MRVLAWTVLFVVFFSTGRLQWIEGHAAQEASIANHPNQAGSKSNNGQQSSQEKEAQAHYRVALVALKNNDLTTAEDELRQATQLVPKNALVLYRLAVVQSKRDESSDAMSNLQSAMRLGLPADVKGPADDLQAELTYKLNKLKVQLAERQKSQAWFDQMAWLLGKWTYTKDFRRNYDCGTEFHSIDNSFELHPDPDNGVLTGTMSLVELHTFNRITSGGCPHVSSSEDSLSALLQIVVKPVEQWNNGRTDIFATFESCKGNYCKSLFHGTTDYIVTRSDEGPILHIGDLRGGGNQLFQRPK
jgi:hypothetical protein